MHYGWVVVWITFVAVLIAAGIRSITGVILIPLEQEFDWSRSSISFAFAINLILYGISGPFIAAGLERLGVRKIMAYYGPVSCRINYKFVHDTYLATSPHLGSHYWIRFGRFFISTFSKYRNDLV